MNTKVLVTGAAGYIGSVLCEHLLDAGYTVMAVDSLLYGQPSLFHLCANPRFQFTHGDVRDEALMRHLVKDADVLMPGALEGQVNAESVQTISERVKIVAEGANGPTTPEADAELKARGIFNIPDFLCNAGGVTTSYFEGVQNDMNFYWSKDEVLKRLDDKMTVAFHDVLAMSEREGVYMRDAAYMVAIEKVVKGMELRGWL